MQLFIDNDLSLYNTSHNYKTPCHIFTIAFVLLHKTCYCFCFEFQLCISLSNMTLSKVFTPMIQDSNLDSLDIITIPIIQFQFFQQRNNVLANCVILQRNSPWLKFLNVSTNVVQFLLERASDLNLFKFIWSCSA